MFANITAYLRECWSATLADWSRGRAMTSLVAALLAVPFVVLFGDRLEWQPSALPFIALFVGVWAGILFLVVTPYRLWLAQRQKIQETEVRLADKFTREERLDALHGLLTTAQELFQRGVTSDTDFIPYRQAFDRFHGSIAAQLAGRLSTAEVGALLAQSVSIMSYTPHHNEIHERILARLDTLMQRISRLIERYSQ